MVSDQKVQVEELNGEHIQSSADDVDEVPKTHGEGEDRRQDSFLKELLLGFR